MNFDQLKNEWNKEEANGLIVSENILKIKEAHTPIDNIRKKMKSEFFTQILSLIVLAFIPRIFNFSPEMKPIFIAFYAMASGFTAYYFFKFYLIYKNSYNMTIDTRKNLLWFYYEMKLNIELYKALTYMLGLIALAGFIAYIFINKGAPINVDAKKLTFVIVLVCFSSIFLIGLATELWTRYYYGKDLKKVKDIIDQLDDE
ncbi:hypothetical protein [Pedobacter sp. Hv1]|uniref:hypothetical protein n=1 Tax=Pedobacter sp. Hv1 TaxID=1740090 RepID=UPI0006D89BF0|nr:hypothetical protein [Pedobacter sp. Hv1]KQC01842.1 hypothetical protein AQF98_05620 [Pedobacter sp. Hv1]